MEISLTTLRALLLETSELASEKTLVEAGLLKPYISKSQANKMYGRGNVDRWVFEGLVKLIKDGNDSSKIRISRTEIKAVAKASNRTTYTTVDERKNPEKD